MIDMTNWVMKEHGVPDSKWTVISYVGKSKWHCVCECGNVSDVDGNSLRRGNSKSCGKCGSKKTKTIDMTGWNMWEHGVPNSKITVIKQVPSNGHALWECKCSCGNPQHFNVDGCNLRNGHTLSCGCIKIGINQKDRSNQYINDIWVGPIVGKNNNGSYLYDCICFCGNHFISDFTRILNGHKQSCGCLKSKGEAKIKALLDLLKIPYIQEYQLLDLLGEHNEPRRMDFAILKNDKIQCFIEYQGEQHYKINSPWYSGAADEEKRVYCKVKNIPLIEISYKDYDKLSETYIKDLLKEMVKESK